MTSQASTTEVVATTTRSNSTASTNVLPTPRVTVEGVRRIWGTHNHATTKTIENAIARFCNVQGLRIKRKTSRNRQTRKTSWWFVIHAQESVLQELDSKWDALSTQTSWTLKQCTKPQDTEEDTVPISPAIISATEQVAHRSPQQTSSVSIDQPPHATYL